MIWKVTIVRNSHIVTRKSIKLQLWEKAYSVTIVSNIKITLDFFGNRLQQIGISRNKRLILLNKK